ncbi:MAG: Asp-tRNA(Asn)/Glu-tRNA(Gln) amidotransferase subunit GatA, partial [Alphaproteobacteria bacterium]|nr:Asp-tRNA(Asn)/Glu-tRNA(Gln) amidotransferase subunit GatA [Alphaproteobacteria bacterium]
AAKRSDQRLQKGQVGAMEGKPIGIKDLFCTKNVKTTAGSKILSNFIPPYESTVTQNLWDAGAIMLGKLNLDEFAMGSSTLASAFGPTVNPWQRTSDNKPLVPGGSSGGSAAAVASYSAMAATATDTGGSIRQPAALCGLVGIKPTYGLCSRYGTVAFASSLDQAGVITRTVRDSAIMLQVMISHDPKDGTSLNHALPNLEAALTGNIKGLKVGIPNEYRTSNLKKDMSDTWDKGIDWLKQAGAEIREVSLPHTKYALPTYYILAPAEASSNLSRYDGLRYGLRVEGHTLDEMYENTRAEGFGTEVKRRIMVGTYVLSAGYYDAYYLQAQKVRSLIKQDFNTAFKSVDVLLTPSTPTGAFALDEPSTDPIEMYMQDVFTVPVNLAGLPALSLPAGLSKEGLPLGLQLIGPNFSEDLLLRTADVMDTLATFDEGRQTLRNTK